MLNELLEKEAIHSQKIYQILSDLYTKKVTYTDLYFQYNLLESWHLQDGIIQEGSYSIDHGVGIRAIIDEKTAFAYSDALDLDSILSGCDFVSQTINQSLSKNKEIKSFKKYQSIEHYTQNNPLNSLKNIQKIAILKKIDALARKNPFVVQVDASLTGSWTEILVASSDGDYSPDYRPMIRLNVTIVAQKDGRTEQASSGGGGRFTYQHFLDEELASVYTNNALRQVMIALESKPALAGVMPVILGSGWPGVLLHEAIGHGLEGDFNRKKTSVYSDKIDQQIASDLCTIIDNGTLKNRRGSLNIDDEGTPTQKTTLVKDGILKQYMLDKHNAKLMGLKSTGNGRRESYAHLPLPRMTNTYLLPGKDSVEEMISSVDKGIYAVNFDGGQVDVVSGKFVFSANEAYLIENGQIKYPIKGATLIGQGDEVLKKISMLGGDLALDSGVGVCGKEGQSVPVGVGQPSLKIDKLTIGGSKI